MAAEVPALAKETCDAEMDVKARNNCFGSHDQMGKCKTVIMPLFEM